MKCKNCKWYDTTRNVGGSNNIPTDPETGDRIDFCGYYDLIIDFSPEMEHNCPNFSHWTEDARCKNCAECTKEITGQCPSIMCKNCCTCSLKEFGSCHYTQCDDCGYCKYWDDDCYKENWRESWDIYLIERFSQQYYY